MSLEIVSHCWRYSRLLNLQLSSFVASSQGLPIRFTVFASFDDTPTIDTVAAFAAIDSRIHLWSIETPRLLRRAIGRNLAARETRATWVWFADCDYLFGDGCLRATLDLCAATQADLVYPRYVKRTNHNGGDWLIADVPRDRPGPLAIDYSYFVEFAKLNRAIGGIQIVRGDVARERGYLPDSRYQREACVWQRTFEDAVFRRSLGGRGTPIDVPNLFRIRHSKRGRTDIGVEL